MIFLRKLIVDKVANLCYYILVANQYAPLAQKVEHMTFNHGVRSSTLRWSTKPVAFATGFFFFLMMLGVKLGFIGMFALIFRDCFAPLFQKRKPSGLSDNRPFLLIAFLWAYFGKEKRLKSFGV